MDPGRSFAHPPSEREPLDPSDRYDAVTPDDPDRFVDFGTPGAQEWWYFDALSDDCRDALVIIFFSNFIFSPRYNRAAIEGRRQPPAPPRSGR